VRFTLANETQERIATVYLIGREIRADRTIRIHCHIDKEDRDLLPGMYLKAIVETGGAKVDALPSEAILDFLGKKYVFIPAKEGDGHEDARKEDGAAGQMPSKSFQFRMVEVGVGNSENGFTEVVLPQYWAETQVVVKGAYTILSKLKNSEEEGHGH